MFNYNYSYHDAVTWHAPLPPSRTPAQIIGGVMPPIKA